MISDIKEVSTCWGLDIRETKKLSENATLLITTQDEKYILKKKESIEAINRELELLLHLIANGINVHMPLSNNDGEYIITADGEYYSIYSYLMGETIGAIESIENQQLPLLLGKTLATLHLELKNVPIADKFSAKDLYKTIYGWAVKEILTKDSDDKLKMIYEILEPEIKNAVKILPKQLIHRDAHISNIIILHQELSGIIDFDLTEVNVRIFDICYCATSILSEVFHESHFRELWIPFVGDLVNQYSKTNPLTELEFQYIWHIMLSIQTIFMAYFTGYPELYRTNKDMFLWIYENKGKIEKQTLEDK